MTWQMRWVGVLAACSIAPMVLHGQTPETPQLPDTIKPYTLAPVSDSAKPHTLAPVRVTVTRTELPLARIP
ncbi:MAG TPA: hypothetical protein VLJ83_05495, partial [Gemmatimonadaceae bacterium]|nr:hypothetical protein [Gemmatimonadaceae bacterium]